MKIRVIESATRSSFLFIQKASPICGAYIHELHVPRLLVSFIRHPVWMVVTHSPLNRFANSSVLASRRRLAPLLAPRAGRGQEERLRGTTWKEEIRGENGRVGREQFVKAGKEPSVSGYDRGMRGTIAKAFYALVIGRVSPRPGIPGMRRSRGSTARQLVPPRMPPGTYRPRVRSVPPKGQKRES